MKAYQPRRRPPGERPIRLMFDEIVNRYDLLNSVMSLGLDRHWRAETAATVALQSNDRVLDLGCGTGRLGSLLSDRSRVVGVDVSLPMLKRAQWAVQPPMSLVQGSAFRLPFADGQFWAVVSGFVLRNLFDLEGAFSEVQRVVRPGGSIAFFDATEPRSSLVRGVFDRYFGTVAPVLGTVVGRGQAYKYLVSSLGHLPDGVELCRMLERAGFRNCQARLLTFGTVILLTAQRPAV